MRKYDIVLYGATGFTGKRAVAYFQEHAPEGLQWAIAARNADKLTELKKELDLEVAVIIAEATNSEDIEALVSQTKVVLSTAGPYDLYGSELVKHCAKQGVHYVDITGEAPWVNQMIKEHGTTAKQTGARIISFCGFDSIPADLGVWKLQQFFRQKWQKEVSTAEGYYVLSGGGLNGGTLLSALNMMEKGQTDQMTNDALLLSDLEQQDFVVKQNESFKNRYSKEVNKWVYPFVMGEINTKVVYRSVGLQLEQNPNLLPHFSYDEYHAIGGRFPSIMAAYGMAAFNVLSKSRSMRKFLKLIGPKTNQGPTEEQIEEGFFRLKVIGQDADKQHKAMMTMQFHGDAGNKATVMFLCECAFMLAEESANPALQKELAVGFLTPSIAFGNRLYERLQARGLQIDCKVIKEVSK